MWNVHNTFIFEHIDKYNVKRFIFCYAQIRISRSFVFWSCLCLLKTATLPLFRTSNGIVGTDHKTLHADFNYLNFNHWELTFDWVMSAFGSLSKGQEIIPIWCPLANHLCFIVIKFKYVQGWGLGCQLWGGEGHGVSLHRGPYPVQLGLSWTRLNMFREVPVW